MVAQRATLGADDLPTPAIAYRDAVHHSEHCSGRSPVLLWLFTLGLIGWGGCISSSSTTTTSRLHRVADKGAQSELARAVGVGQQHQQPQRGGAGGVTISIGAVVFAVLGLIHATGGGSSDGTGKVDAGLAGRHAAQGLQRHRHHLLLRHVDAPRVRRALAHAAVVHQVLALVRPGRRPHAVVAPRGRHGRELVEGHQLRHAEAVDVHHHRVQVGRHDAGDVARRAREVAADDVHLQVRRRPPRPLARRVHHATVRLLQRIQHREVVGGDGGRLRRRGLLGWARAAVAGHHLGCRCQHRRGRRRCSRPAALGTVARSAVIAWQHGNADDGGRVEVQACQQ